MKTKSEAILWLLAAAASGIYIVKPITDPDLWWHLTAGRWILHHGSVPAVDYWNMFAVGTPWRSYSWSFEALAAFLDNNFGVSGLLVLKCIFGVFLGLALAFVYSKLASDWFFGLLLGVFVTASCFNHATLRPQFFSWGLFGLSFLIAASVKTSGITHTALLGFMVVMAMWANLHITTILGILVVAVWSFHPRKIKATIGIVLAGIIATLFTPYLGGEWLTFFGKIGHPFEHAGVSEFNEGTITQTTVVLLVLLSLISALLLFRKQDAFQLEEVGVVGVFIVMGLAVVKFLPHALIAVGALTAVLWSRIDEELRSKDNLLATIGKLQEGVSRAPKSMIILLFVAFFLGKLTVLFQAALDDNRVPVEAVDFIEQKGLKQPVLVTFDEGGYLMYRQSRIDGSISHQVAIDGRTNITPHEVWEQFIASYRGEPNWREYIKTVGANTILWKEKSPLYSLLNLDPEWCLVHKSGHSGREHVIFVKRRDELVPCIN